MRKAIILNDTFFRVKLAKEAVEQLLDTKFEFEVSKAGKMRASACNNGQRIKNRIVNRNI